MSVESVRKSTRVNISPRPLLPVLADEDAWYTHLASYLQELVRQGKRPATVDAYRKALRTFRACKRVERSRPAQHQPDILRSDQAHLSHRRHGEGGCTAPARFCSRVAATGALTAPQDAPAGVSADRVHVPRSQDRRSPDCAHRRVRDLGPGNRHRDPRVQIHGRPRPTIHSG
jgi:hypothetical protein